MSLLKRVRARYEYPGLSAPDLLAESGQRADAAERAARAAYGRFAWVDAPELPATRHLPDPYGPDPVVFGSVPRVRGD